jgi:8-oxo-dGTP diphosphatase
MRHRAGAILIEDGKVALIERHRAGTHYFVFPGGGIDQNESPEQAAIREMLEETGLQVEIRQKIVEIHFANASQHFYFLVEKTGGQFGTGKGEEFTDSDPDDPNQGIYAPVWMPVEELIKHDNVYPASVAELVARSLSDGWPRDVEKIIEKVG